MTDEAGDQAKATTDAFCSELSAARQGDRSQLGSLLDLFREYLTAHASRGMSKDIASKLGVSDIVQDTMFEASREFSTFRGSQKSELRAWLTSILDRNLIDTHRHFRSYAKRDISRECHWTFAATEGAEPTQKSTRSSSQQYLCCLDVAFQHLNRNEQNLIQLRTFEGRSFAEVGQQIGQTADAARKQWSRAIRKLTEELRRYERRFV